MPPPPEARVTPSSPKSGAPSASPGRCSQATHCPLPAQHSGAGPTSWLCRSFPSSTEPGTEAVWSEGPQDHPVPTVVLECSGRAHCRHLMGGGGAPADGERAEGPCGKPGRSGRCPRAPLCSTPNTLPRACPHSGPRPRPRPTGPHPQTSGAGAGHARARERRLGPFLLPGLASLFLLSTHGHTGNGGHDRSSSRLHSVFPCAGPSYQSEDSVGFAPLTFTRLVR